jgi:hypothetical protein
MTDRYITQRGYIDFPIIIEGEKSGLDGGWRADDENGQLLALIDLKHNEIISISFNHERIKLVCKFLNTGLWE